MSIGGGAGGKGGRPHKPTHLKLVTGTQRPGRRNKHEPKPGLGLPPAAKWMSPRGREIYGRLAAMFEANRVGTTDDGWSLELIADAMDLYQEVRAYLAVNGTAYDSETENGTIRRPNPEFAQAKELRNFIFTALGAFGANPSARAKVMAGVIGEESPADAYFGS